jgi:hypothetical protein
MMLIIPLCSNSVVLVILLQENTSSFDDLGKLLLGGVAAAIVVAVGFTIVRFKLRGRKPETSSFLSISSEKE